MKFMGSKARLAKELLSTILPFRLKKQLWVEPFVGGGNLLDKVTGPRLASDVDPHVISALKTIRDSLHLIPKSKSQFSEQDYASIKANPEHPLYGYVGFALSYGGKWFGGWRRDSQQQRDYVAEAYRNAVHQSKLLQGAKLLCCSYLKLKIPPESLVYCDPPYQNTTKYRTSNHFDSKQFWEWVRSLHGLGHTVFVSEYEAPSDFHCVYQKLLTSSLTADTGSKSAIEKLFTLTI